MKWDCPRCGQDLRLPPMRLRPPRKTQPKKDGRKTQ